MNILRYCPFIAYIYDIVVNKEGNVVIIINGSTNSGKTYAGLRLLKDLSKLLGTQFNIKNNVDFNFKELVKKMRLPQNLSAGSGFLFEEVGAVGGGAASTEWQTKANKVFGSFLQTTRVKRRILVMTCPTFVDLDVKGRRLVHIRIEMININRKNKVSTGLFKAIQVNRRTGDDYHKNLRFGFDGRDIIGRTIEFGLPDKNDIKLYEIEKQRYVDSLEDDVVKDDTKEKEKKEHIHSWRVRITKNDRYCRTCGIIEPINQEKLGKSGIGVGHPQ